MLLTDLNFVDIYSLSKPPLALTQKDIIATHLPLSHFTIIRERPVFEPIASLPLHLIMSILILIPELHGDLVICKGEQLLSKLIIVFLLPFLGEKLDYLISSLNELVTIAPC